MKPLHPEQIRAALRIKFKTLRAFELAYGLPQESTRDVLRGRPAAKTAAAMADAINVPVETVLKLKRPQSSMTDNTSRKRDSHSLNAGAK